MWAGSLPRATTPMPTVAARMAAASLEPSPTIAHTHAGALQRLDDLDLVLRCHPGEDHPLGDDPLLVLARQRVPLGAADHLLGGHRQAELLGDRRGGDRVIAGDQLDAHPERTQIREQAGGFGARGVGQAEEPGQRQPVLGQNSAMSSGFSSIA